MQTTFVAAAIASFEGRRKIARPSRRGALATFLLCACAAASCAALERGPRATRDMDDESEREHGRPPLSPSEPIAVGIVIVDGVHDTELMAPCDVFRHTALYARPGMSVFTVAPSTRAVRTFGGLRLVPDHDFETAPHIDILVIPSTAHSRGSDLEDRELLEFVREQAERARYVVALREAAFVLAQAGVLTDHSCTTFPAHTAELKQRFPALDVQTEMSFVQSGRFITSQGGVRSYDPALYLAELIYGMDAAQSIGEGLCIDWNLGRVPYIGTLDQPQPRDEERHKRKAESE